MEWAAADVEILEVRVLFQEGEFVIGGVEEQHVVA